MTLYPPICGRRLLGKWYFFDQKILNPFFGPKKRDLKAVTCETKPLARIETERETDLMTTNLSDLITTPLYDLITTPCKTHLRSGDLTTVRASPQVEIAKKPAISSLLNLEAQASHTSGLFSQVLPSGPVFDP